MIRDRKFEVGSLAQLKERVIYKNPNSKIHHKKQLGKDPRSERVQLRDLPIGESWFYNCESQQDFLRLGKLCIQSGHRGIPRKRIGRSLVWSLPDGMQALLWSLPKDELQKMLRLMVHQFKGVLEHFFPGAPCVIALHCDKARIHLEALLLKYHFTFGPRGKTTAHLYESFRGYKADSAYNTAHVASSVYYGLTDPGCSRVNSKMTRELTSLVKHRLHLICRSLNSVAASAVARDALETFNALRVIRSDLSFYGKRDWHEIVFAEKAKTCKKVPSGKAQDFVRLLERGRCMSASWMADWSDRIRKIRERRRKKELERKMLNEQEIMLDQDLECDSPKSPVNADSSRSISIG